MATVDDLRFFVRLAAAGNLSEAARRSNSSAPAMSRRLAALEARLGVRLVDRSSRRFALTEEGSLFLDRARRIAGDLDELEAELSGYRGTPVGTLRIGAPTEIGRRRIAPLIGEFHARNPEVQCELVLSDAGLEIARDELDYVFRTAPPTEPSVIDTVLLESRRVICAAPSYVARAGLPTVPADLARHDCLCLVRGREVNDRWRFASPAGRVEVRVRPVLSSTSGEVVHGWALEGRGLALKAGWDIEAGLRAGLLVACMEDQVDERLELHGVCGKRAHQPRRLRSFIDFAGEALTMSAPS